VDTSSVIVWESVTEIWDGTGKNKGWISDTLEMRFIENPGEEVHLILDGVGLHLCCLCGLVVCAHRWVMTVKCLSVV
jgi:hypothetical protein